MILLRQTRERKVPPLKSVVVGPGPVDACLKRPRVFAVSTNQTTLFLLPKIIRFGGEILTICSGKIKIELKFYSASYGEILKELQDRNRPVIATTSVNFYNDGKINIEGKQQFACNLTDVALTRVEWYPPLT
ncbi:hypothetical protein TNCV_3175021 [Trichonephila clavipes]|nr:hypothetical protein TNCV_3175021 [Trichonephila clavipes]